MARQLIKTIKDDAPLGAILHSILDEAAFQAEQGSGWILCDGRDVTGSRYETVTGNANIPDLRGRFLRGKNNGRVAGANPDGELNLGQEQGHATSVSGVGATTVADGNHNHNQAHNSQGAVTAGGWDGSIGPYLAQRGSVGDSFYRLMGTNQVPNVALGSSNGSHTHTVNLSGANETRVDNTTVNYYIRVE